MNPIKRRLLIALVISVGVHLPVVYLGAIAMMRGEATEGEARFLEVMPFSRDASEMTDPTEEEREEHEEYDPTDELPDGQVVDSPAAGESRPSEDARFLAERDQTVQGQSRARFRARGEPNPDNQPYVPPITGSGQPQPRQPEQRMIAGLMHHDLGLEPGEEGEHAADQSPPPSMSDSLELTPSLAAMSDAVGGTGLDNLGDLNEGERTLLTTARWLHAPFFQRVKRQVEQYWHPDVAFRHHDPGGHVYGYRDRETVVRVVLNAEGVLETLYVLRASGAQFLDDEALQAIEQAAPFPNPPRGLVDERTQQIVFTFGFTVELGERPIFRLRRYR